MSSKINLQTCEYARKSSIFQDNQLIYNKKIKKIVGGLLEVGCIISVVALIMTLGAEKT